MHSYMPAGGAGRVAAVTVASPARRPDVPAVRKLPMVRPGECADVAGHGLLTRFHEGCRCGWCASRAREGTCPCPACVKVRAHVYLVLPPGWRH
jgi:hypothetical protein